MDERGGRFLFLCKKDGFPWRVVMEARDTQDAAERTHKWLRENVPDSSPELIAPTAIEAVIEGKEVTLTFDHIGFIP